MEIKKAKKLSGSLAIPEINPFLTELSCSALLQKALPGSQIFWRAQTVSQLFPVSGKWVLTLKIQKERSWSTEKVSMVSVLHQRLLMSATAALPPVSSRDPCRTELCIRAYRRCFHPETPYETDHDSAFPNGCRYHKSQRKRMCAA